MYTRYTFTILCGDKRQLEIAKNLISLGHRVRLYGIIDAHTVSGACIFTDWKNSIEDCDVILLPLPLTRDGETVNMANDLTVSPVSLDELYKAVKKCGCKYILGGLLPDKSINAFGNDIFIADYYAEETLQLKNAIPSAEGAMMIAMEHTDTTICGMSATISGYGRIGSYLCDILHKLGARVTVAARDENALRSAISKGYDTIKLGEQNNKLVEKLNSCKLIFNTVPHVIFTRTIVDKVESKPLYIEIASGKGGIDVTAARAKGFEIICAPSIPAKYSPKSAGIYIFETVKEILSKRGVEL